MTRKHPPGQRAITYILLPDPSLGRESGVNSSPALGEGNFHLIIFTEICDRLRLDRNKPFALRPDALDTSAICKNFREGSNVYSQLGNSDCLPEPGLQHRSYIEQILCRIPPAVDQLIALVNLDSEPVCVLSQVPFASQLDHQR